MDFTNLLYTVDYIAIFYFFIVNSTYIFLNLAAFFTIRRHWYLNQITDFDKTFQSEFYKPLSIIVPAFNEQSTIVQNVKSIISLAYPEFEVVVVNDGSTDDTINELKNSFNLIKSSRSFEKILATESINNVYDSLDYANLVVVDKANGGKADALNAGINTSQYPLVCNIDADSIIEGQALLRIVEPFVQDWRVIAAGGTVRVANECTIRGGFIEKVRLSSNSIVRMQVVEYLRAFLFGRVGWASINSLLIISGAFGVFRKKHLIDAGGYSRDTVGEDMELVLRLNRFLKKSKREYRVVFLPDPVCWTQVPEDIGSLSRQRRRWQRGLGESLSKNRELFFNPKYGLLGIIAFPFFLFIEFLGPVFELLGYIVFAATIFIAYFLGFPGREIILLFFVTAILMGVLLSTLSVVFEEMTFRKYTRLRDKIILFLFGIYENFGYRQRHTFWRVRGIYDFLRKRKGWGEMKRMTFAGQERMDNNGDTSD
ncbi:glycosyltransferase family 2 protein [Natranaerofaba carboxydovora]|uniref:glycosyltransferase family 2 protein n=1 Tax=Natranaerofaba carboxydovora TaxID=2742683 RepID=UPI001F13E2A6|nr:glycosyltransferase [Natranaerofaba carboxydovora]UMZ72669.1 Poly-beta-1,6-N-acetyl-D-glucosamine synthase [Natranaerofaba carboxydovora]